MLTSDIIAALAADSQAYAIGGTLSREGVSGGASTPNGPTPGTHVASPTGGYLWLPQLGAACTEGTMGLTWMGTPGQGVLGVRPLPDKAFKDQGVWPASLLGLGQVTIRRAAHWKMTMLWQL